MRTKEEQVNCYSPQTASAPDTIFALSSGRGPAAIAVVRISGPQAGEALRALIGRVPEPRRAALARVRDPASGEVIDQGLALWFPAPKSETGEDVVELQLHGGRAVIAATLAALAQIEGLRPAEAGEFTRRAFANGKLDLTEVEGLADLIAAETEGQRRQALRQLQGLLGDKAEDWRRRLIEALALTEAGIDFADEELPGNLLPQVRAIAQALADEIAAALDDGRRGERLRDGLVVAIAGPPNAGKSTLLNRLAGRDAAIVSPYAGTTRDAIEVHLDLGGCPVTLVDTAGIRETRDPVEREGVNRALARAEAADLVLWVVDATEPVPAPPPSGGRPTWLIRNKIDLCEVGADWPGSDESIVECYNNGHNISAARGDGFTSLLAGLREAAGSLAGEPALITRHRHRQALHEAHHALLRALQSDGDEILAEELRLAARALGRLTGRVDVEEVLEVIFREFCVGK
jgi:tRNA modification GTPase